MTFLNLFNSKKKFSIQNLSKDFQVIPEVFESVGLRVSLQPQILVTWSNKVIEN